MARSRAAALKALELDPDLAEAHVSLGLVQMYSWDWSEAESTFRHAIALNPGLVWGHSMYALQLAYVGRYEESDAELKRARGLDPLAVSPAILDLTLMFESQDRHELASVQLRTAMELDPASAAARNALGIYECNRGEREKAIASLEKAIALAPDDPLILADLGYCHAITGSRDEAQRLLGELEEWSDREYVDPVSLARLHASLGEKEEAFALLERAYELRSHSLPKIALDARFDPLRSDPRFQDLLRRIGLPQS
jgi:tetratricopeptide (TPR) repeat protein